MLNEWEAQGFELPQDLEDVLYTSHLYIPVKERLGWIRGSNLGFSTPLQVQFCSPFLLFLFPFSFTFLSFPPFHYHFPPLFFLFLHFPVISLKISHLVCLSKRIVLPTKNPFNIVLYCDKIKKMKCFFFAAMKIKIADNEILFHFI